MAKYTAQSVQKAAATFLQLEVDNNPVMQAKCSLLLRRMSVETRLSVHQIKRGILTLAIGGVVR